MQKIFLIVSWETKKFIGKYMVFCILLKQSKTLWLKSSYNDIPAKLLTLFKQVFHLHLKFLYFKKWQRFKWFLTIV